MTTSFDARAITQPGGLYASVNDGIRQSMLAHIASKDRNREREVGVRRDERQNRRQQMAMALANAERYGVNPASTDAGWLEDGDEALIDAAIARRNQHESIAREERTRGRFRDALTMAEKTGIVPDGVSFPEVPGGFQALTATAEQRRADIAEEKRRRSLTALGDTAVVGDRLVNAQVPPNMDAVREAGLDPFGVGLGRIQRDAETIRQQQLEAEAMRSRARGRRVDMGDARYAADIATRGRLGLPIGQGMIVPHDRASDYARVYEQELERLMVEPVEPTPPQAPGLMDSLGGFLQRLGPQAAPPPTRDPNVAPATSATSPAFIEDAAPVPVAPTSGDGYRGAMQRAWGLEAGQDPGWGNPLSAVMNAGMSMVGDDPMAEDRDSAALAQRMQERAERSTVLGPKATALHAQLLAASPQQQDAFLEDLAVRDPELLDALQKRDRFQPPGRRLADVRQSRQPLVQAATP